jgi:hypothetical protein
MKAAHRLMRAATIVSVTAPGASQHMKRKLDAIVVIATHFALSGIACRSRHALIGPPRVGCDTSHLSKRGDVRAKMAADRIKNGVVGRSGRTTPTIPRAMEAQAKAIIKLRISVLQGPCRF